MYVAGDISKVNMSKNMEEWMWKLKKHRVIQRKIKTEWRQICVPYTLQDHITLSK